VPRHITTSESVVFICVVFITSVVTLSQVSNAKIAQDLLEEIKSNIPA
jgi:hypothetical protein